MLDIKVIRKNPQLIQKGNNAKGFKVDVDKILRLDDEIRPLQQDWENSQALRNKLSREIAQASPAEREKLKREVLSIKEKMEDLESQLKEKKAILQERLLEIAQPPREDVPQGKDDKDNVEIRKWGTPRAFDFEPLEHVSLGEKRDILDIERGVRLSGSRSYVLKGAGALLERAILNLTYDLVVKKGFTPMSVPVLVKEEAMVGTGYFPTGREQAYFIEKDKLALVGTAEVSLCSFHSGEVLREEDLPLKLMAQTSCFRREAGTYGRDTHGLYRVHQFQKIEMVVISPADHAINDQCHEELLSISEEVLQLLELPYRVVYVCTGDLGQGQVYKHDIETWMPSRKAYGETHSCSSFYEFQSRRLNMRYKTKDGKNAFTYTLNNTALATPRVILALLENFQEKDGTIKLPAALHPYMGRDTI
ncbi:MAG: serine--tRNA ligase [Deltaproteobacteria bacterium]|nr:serine--tRNA ligase [Deltaproteobacteria bacterium]